MTTMLLKTALLTLHLILVSMHVSVLYEASASSVSASASVRLSTREFRDGAIYPDRPQLAGRYAQPTQRTYQHALDNPRPAGQRTIAQSHISHNSHNRQPLRQPHDGQHQQHLQKYRALQTPAQQSRHGVQDWTGASHEPPAVISDLQVSIDAFGWKLAHVIGPLIHLWRRPSKSRPPESNIDRVQETLERLGQRGLLAAMPRAATGLSRPPPSDMSFAVHLLLGSDADHGRVVALFNSLANADYTGISDAADASSIDLYIHVDVPASTAVMSVARSFRWPHGTKRFDYRYDHRSLPMVMTAAWPVGAPFALLLDHTATVSPLYAQYAKWCINIMLKRHTTSSMPQPVSQHNVVGCALDTLRYGTTPAAATPDTAAKGGSSHNAGTGADGGRFVPLVYGRADRLSGVVYRKSAWQSMEASFTRWAVPRDWGVSVDEESIHVSKQTPSGPDFEPDAQSTLAWKRFYKHHMAATQGLLVYPDLHLDNKTFVVHTSLLPALAEPERDASQSRETRRSNSGSQAVHTDGTRKVADAALLALEPAQPSGSRLFGSGDREAVFERLPGSALEATRMEQWIPLADSPFEKHDE
ncbi:hypothetical protein BC831DRAFT_444553 [Entophlyctis helioformis]|nr:hypothetical protein BC831DRAFT_444553 [Entophlyctis helioformis]